jgi:2-haloacid dehalogenase
MKPTLAIDVYGTLIDTHDVVKALQPWLDTRAAAFSQAWRDKQLEYSFRRAVMKQYQPFSVCTEQAFDFVCQQFELALSPAVRSDLIAQYQHLSAFSEVIDALKQLKSAGYALYAFTNGAKAPVSQLLSQAAVLPFLIDIISVDEISSFKPDPTVYRHLLKRTQSTLENTWLVSSNSFDIIGAQYVGLKTAWVQRTPKTLLDPWGVKPDRVIQGLDQLIDAIS